MWRLHASMHCHMQGTTCIGRKGFLISRQTVYKEKDFSMLSASDLDRCAMSSPFYVESTVVYNSNGKRMQSAHNAGTDQAPWIQAQMSKADPTPYSNLFDYFDGWLSMSSSSKKDHCNRGHLLNRTHARRRRDVDEDDYKMVIEE